jgi:hypothetical protein
MAYACKAVSTERRQQRAPRASLGGVALLKAADKYSGNDAWSRQGGSFSSDCWPTESAEITGQ